jgi:hypothetical protein
MIIDILIAQTGNGAASVADNSLAIAKEIDLAMAGTWKDTLTGPLYRIVCNYGAGIMGFGCLFGIAATLRSEMHKQTPTPSITVETMIIFAVIALMLGTPVNRGKFLGEFSMFSHRQFQNAGNALLSQVREGIQYDLTQQAQTKTYMEAVIPQQIDDCLGIDDVQKRDFCLQRLDDKIRGETEQYPQQAWARQLYERWHQDINRALSNQNRDPWDPIGDMVRTGGAIVGGLGQGASYLIIQSLLVSVGTAFLYGMSQIALIAYQVLPLFIGLSPFSQDFTSAKVAIGGIIGIEGAPILYKVLTANVSQTILNSSSIDPLTMPLLLAAVAVAMALALVAGGGVGLVQIFASFRGARQ